MELSIDQLRQLLCQQSPVPVQRTGLTGPPASPTLSIVIADKGHIWVGTVAHEGDWCVVRQGACIRIWGTQRGLGELADEGPKSGTKLDPVREVRVSHRAVIAVIPCKEGPWASKL